MSLDFEDFSGAVLEVEETLVAGAAKLQGKVAFGENKRTINKGVERFQKLDRVAAEFEDFLISEAREGPDIPAELGATPVGDLLASGGLDEGFAATEGDAGLAGKCAKFGFYFLDIDEDATIKVPGFRILAARAAVGAALRPENCTQAIPIHNVIVLKRSGKADLH